MSILYVRDKDGQFTQIPIFAAPDSGGNVELDTTLTQSGKAADAKAVGDKIAEITGISLVEPAEDDIPKVFITGVKPTTKDDVLAEMEYISKTDRFHAYLEIKCQGSSSMNYAKKNFTIKLYSDEARETKLKKDFKDWNHPGNKYVLKANYIDHSHARNIVSARLWGEIVASRPDYDSLPVEMRNAPNNGAVDGFPIKVYYNGTYEGVYTWNIGKDDWMWGMDEDNPNHVLLCAETNTNGIYNETPCNFRALWSGVNESNWSVEVGTNSTAVKNSLNNLIQFVMDNDGESFRNGIGQYLDIQSAIDYYIFMYDICGLDSLARNMLLATYDGVKWICGAYDLDSTFGMWYNGSKFVATDFACPEAYQERFSLLWERIESNYVSELKARLAELRKSVLSYFNIVTHFERFMDVIGLDLYAEDLTVYTSIPSGSTNNITQIRNYIRDRQAYVDAEFAAMSAPVPCTGISLNTNTLTFTEEGTQTLTAIVTPDGCTDAITWESNNTSVATVNGGVVTAIANGSAVITARCGEYSASCSVAVSGIYEPIPCTAISLDKTELTINGEGTQTITATVTPSDTTDSVVWVSSAPAVASITVDGNVCTVQSNGNGNATITVTCGNQSASCEVTVSGIESYLYKNYSPNGATFTSEVSIDWDTQFIEADIDLTTCTGSNEKILTVGENIATWTNSNSYHINYTASSNTLLIYAINGGGRPYGSCARIYPYDKNVILRIDKDGVKVDCVALTESDYTFADNGIADGTGAMYTAFAEYIKTLPTVQIGSTEGNSRSHATYNYIKVDSAVPCTGFTLDKTERAFNGEGTQTIVATVTPSNANDAIAWTSDKPYIATVKGGVVTPVANGTAIITAKCGNFTATCSVTVSGLHAPCALVDGTASLNSGGQTVTVANNHVKIEYATATTRNLMVNLSNVAKYGTDTAYKTKMFTLKAGDVMYTKMSNVSGPNGKELSMWWKSSANKEISCFNSNQTFNSGVTTFECTKNITEDVTLGLLGMWTGCDSPVGTVIEFDLEIYINGERYV